MFTRVLLALALIASNVSAFSLGPGRLAPGRQGTLALKACAASGNPASSALGRRELLAGAAAAVPLALGASPALAARPKPSNGKWAKHEGPFDPAELEGFETTASGLQYKDIEVGTGAVPQPGQLIAAHYSGYLLSNGKQFDSSYSRGKPLSFSVGTGNVIKGWDEALLSMPVGTKRQLLIPAPLAYGSRAVGGGLIPANSDLVFFVELVRIGG